MSDVELREIDPADEAALRAWWAVARAASAERAFDAWPVWEVAQVAATQDRTDGRAVLLLALRDGDVVGSG